MHHLQLNVEERQGQIGHLHIYIISYCTTVSYFFYYVTWIGKNRRNIPHPIKADGPI